MTNHLRIFCYTIALLFLISLNLNAQPEWREASVINTRGDTLQGEILFGDWDISPSFITFRQDESEQNFSAREISSFELNDPYKSFESKTVSVMYYSEHALAEGQSPVTGTESATVFLEVLLRSPLVSLHEFLDRDKKERFFLTKADTLHELRNVQYKVSKGGKVYNVRRHVYRDQLTQLLWECPSINTAKLSYSARDLANLLKEYHAYCKVDYQLQFEQDNVPQQVYAGVSAGRRVSWGEGHSFVGLGIQLLSKKKFNRNYVLAEVGRLSTDPTEYIDMNRKRSIRTGRMYFGVYGGRYFGSGKWQPHAQVGLSILNGSFDTGVGISYRRFLSALYSIGLYDLAGNNARYAIKLSITPPIKPVTLKRK